MKATLAALVLSAGCFSAGGGLSINGALGDSPVRRIGGHVQVGTFTEVVEDRLVGSLFYSRDLGALGDQSNALAAWGARLSTIGRGLLPGLYVTGAYGQNDELTQQEASTVVVGAGASFARMRPGVTGRGYAGLSLGVVFHRQRQETIDHAAIGHFLGVELTVHAGFDVIGPMFATEDDD
ncbi:MAG: hypothetical protein H0T42_08400 [Deltaproteobacteria bacterium]|nr:hypothetical protein [Deltaproteobacteria bacterium]